MDKPKKQKIVARLALYLLLLFAVLIVSSLISIGVGQGGVGFGDAIRSITSAVTGSSAPAPEIRQIILEVRLPRVILAGLVGMLLAAAGVALQGLLLNPLADPYTVGVSSGAALGASVAIVLGAASWFGGYGVPVAAFVTAMLAMLVVYSLARGRGKLSIHSFLLAGIVVGSFLWALLTFVLTIAGQDMATIMFWLLGNLSSPDPWGYVRMSLPFAVIGFGLLYAFARDLNVYALGDEGARHLGIETEALKTIIIAITSLITAAAVSVSGIIGFVGLIVPHIARKIFGSDHRILLPTAALLGASLLILADTVARTAISSGELPVGVVTALLGAPFFCYLLRTK